MWQSTKIVMDEVHAQFFEQALDVLIYLGAFHWIQGRRLV